MRADDGTPRGGRRPARRIVLIALGAVLLVVLAGGAAALWLGGRVVTARDHLQAAAAEVATVRGAIDASTIAADALDPLAHEARAAVDASHDPLWRVAEGLPGVGEQLRAVRIVAESVDGVAAAAQPLVQRFGGSGALTALAPVDGAIPLDTLTTAGDEVRALRGAIATASDGLGDLPVEDLDPRIADGVTTLRDGLPALAAPLDGIDDVLAVLPGMLGADGPRDWLLLVQNNAEERSSGGNPAAAVVLHVEDGRIEIRRQASSLEFPRPYPEEVLTFDPEWERVYGERVSTFFTSITFDPDFEKTGLLAREMWSRQFGETIDGVVAVDPVALSYLLPATGPIAIPSGQTLTAETAVPFLLSDVYVDYPEPETQDAIFASAARAVFDRLVGGGDLDASALAAAATRIVDEQRFKVWSADPDEEAFLLTTPVATMLPADEEGRTWIGAYTNDDSISKMSYWTDVRIDVRVDACTPAPTYSVGVDVQNLIDDQLAATLPSYVLAGRSGIPFGGERQRVLLYGPVGSTLVGATLDGEEVRFGDDLQAYQNTVADATGADLGTPAVSGVLDGRPVAVLTARIPVGATSRVTAEFTGPDAPLEELAVSRTPRHREVPVDIDRSC